MKDHVVRYAGHHAATADLASVDDVLNHIAERLRLLSTQRIALDDSLDRVLAEDIDADGDFPPFDKSMMDGIALRSTDTLRDDDSPVLLPLLSETAAAGSVTPELPAGCAVRINTGAPLPPGADTVVMIEQCRIDGASVELPANVPQHRHIAAKGSVCRSGERVLQRGTPMGPAHIAAAATVGRAMLQAYRIPRIAVIVTGDELQPAGTPRNAGSIYDSNGPCIRAMCRAAGGELVGPVDACPDDEDRMRDRFAQALAADLIIVAGGMSMGTRDLAPRILTEVGVKWIVHGVNMRPGRPTGFGCGPNGQLVFGLPGNPVSCFVGFHLFVAATLRGMTGRSVRTTLPAARLTHPVKASRDPRPGYLPARLVIDTDGSLHVSAVRWSGSGDPIGLAAANVLMVHDHGDQPLDAGTTVRILPLQPFPA